MNIYLSDLILSFKKQSERINFADVNYFYGQMGAGKSTIARLIDFCLGGSLGDAEMTPALQSEFISASLSLTIEDSPLVLDRDANTNRIRAHFSIDKQEFEILIPARAASGEVLPGTGVEVLSDLIFYLAGKLPPKVRRSKIKEESDLARLSLRDILWYCYLDQELIDSSFFHLEGDANPSKMLKSRDVLRFVVGFHQERVAELEVQLEHIRAQRQKAEAGAKAISEALSSADLASETELFDLRQHLEVELEQASKDLIQARNQTSQLRSHAMESLQERARRLAAEILDFERAEGEIASAISKDRAHINELLALSTRFRRSQSAREVLGGVDFQDCPRCGKALPKRPTDTCPVCGQIHDELPTSPIDEVAAEKDLDSRVAELKDIISRYEDEIKFIQRHIRELKEQKLLVDVDLNRASFSYDSAYLSTALEAERRHAALTQQLSDLKRLEILVHRITEFSDLAVSHLAQEQEIRRTLKEAREKAERDTENLRRLKSLFLDCLLRAKIPGFLETDKVEMRPPHFLPEVVPADDGEFAFTSFSNLGSGGKKTLFKCCFAIAMHRLSAQVGASLPTILIIDSPMKNISERENAEQFLGFYGMLYDLCETELKNVQVVIIDKELVFPWEDFSRSFKERHMMPDSEEFPPLIRYYRGK